MNFLYLDTIYICMRSKEVLKILKITLVKEDLENEIGL